MLNKTIQVTIAENGVCTVKLNRPQVRNALDLPMREELRDFFTEVKNNDDVKVIVLTGEGNTFSAGGDLSASKDVDGANGRKRLQSGHEMVSSIVNLEKPVIAAVNGAAAGAGVSLALACDLIIANHSAVFIQSFSKVGLIPDLGAIYFLPRLIGRHRALEMMFLGDKVSSEQALELGIVNRVVGDESLTNEVYKLAEQLTEGPQMALGLMKKLVNRSVLDDLSHSMELEGFAQAMCFESANFKEGVEAFFEKRKPVFNKS
ncbi:2-(1,2-epoxy-1,2-dihydrophenyl)acetyl-CoA isomerase [Solibacillus kalamii]|uniref:Enoyl-CoA hydratase n=1 Tax=Solibacillus kalamii TaxID=1748298 RepID=A0ABX3ZEJ9_9BACL|nr:enoyl-CoA hydratase-related protein [Solibacillus kalamii]MBM7666981.1 2-(1,2-epoxy-1,2-dihydrophenyl)acetyl-CoA isomerase [Solibacillus kalamii]OUZ38130.1 enoyl-CoA hydratase [Solibacillus kalamii]